jgi:hypothetical protein
VSGKRHRQISCPSSYIQQRPARLKFSLTSVLQDALELTIASEPTHVQLAEALALPLFAQSANQPPGGRPDGTQTDRHRPSSPNGVPIPYDVAIVAGHIVKIFSNLSW